MKDNYGDRIVVSTSEDTVYIDVYNEDALVVHAYTPTKARKLAKQLREAADEIDPREDEPAQVLPGLVALRARVIAEQADNSRGYQHGDTVLLSDIGAVMTYNGDDDAWYSAGPESHSCHNEFDFAKPGSVFLIAHDGKPYNGVSELLTRTGVRTWSVA